MQGKTRTFETRGPVDPEHNYIVPRTTEVADLVRRIKEGRYIVIFAPRQTGKTTFFRCALSALEAKNDNDNVTYLPIQLNFEEYKDIELPTFYTYLKNDLCKEIKNSFVFRQKAVKNKVSFCKFLKEYPITDHISLRGFFEKLQGYLNNCRVTIIIDEFDGIPQSAVSNFLHSLRRIYLSETQNRCSYSLGIVGVKSITQLNYDRSISPFNIQDEKVIILCLTIVQNLKQRKKKKLSKAKKL